MNPALKRRFDQVRRWWWIVLAATVLGGLAATLPTLATPPTYVGKSALVMSSPGRAPEQDTMMVVGYATMFNESVTINRLEDVADIPANVTFEGRTVAASPILIIEATAADPRIAQDAAQKMAETFRDDINSVRQDGNAQSVDDLEAQLAALRNSPSPEGLVNPGLAALQDRINAIKFDSTNQLQDLQLRAGVTQLKPSIKAAFTLGACGGLLLGVLGAVGLGSLSTRLESADELRDKTGIEPLVELPDANSEKSIRLRQERLRVLANIVDLEALPKPAIVALTGSGSRCGTRGLAEELARLSAERGNRTVLVYADDAIPQSADGAGFYDALGGTTPVDRALVNAEISSLRILPPGSVSVDRYSIMTRARISAVLDALRPTADVVFLVAPSIASTAEMQLLCGAADTTVMVIAKNSFRVSDVISAREALEKVHAVLLGAVLIDEKASVRDGEDTRLPTDPPVSRPEDAESTMELEPTVAGKNGSAAH